MEDSNAITENIQIIFSTDKQGIANSINPAAHRYYYKKVFNTEKENILTFVMLNPSDADQYKPDPTIRNIETIVKESKRYNGFAIINLFSYRTAKPKDLKNKILKIKNTKEKDEFTAKNLTYLKDYINGDVVLA